MLECEYKNVCTGYRDNAAACVGKDEQATCGTYNNFPVVYVRQQTR